MNDLVANYEKLANRSVRRIDERKKPKKGRPPQEGLLKLDRPDLAAERLAVVIGDDEAHAMVFADQGGGKRRSGIRLEARLSPQPFP